MESDPIGLQAGPNTYLYANAQPNLTTDPEGLNPATGAVWGGYVGTAIGGVLGGPPGAWAGRVLGAGIGAGLGYLVVKCMEDDDEDDNCEALYQSTLRTCASLKGRKKFMCFEAARENREQCYQQRNKDRK